MPIWIYLMRVAKTPCSTESDIFNITTDSLTQCPASNDDNYYIYIVKKGSSQVKLFD